MGRKVREETEGQTRKMVEDETGVEVEGPLHLWCLDWCVEKSGGAVSVGVKGREEAEEIVAHFSS